MPEYVSKVSIQRGVPTVHRAGRTIDGDARAYCGITKLRRCVAGRTIDGDARAYCGITKLRRCVTVEEYRQHYALPLRPAPRATPTAFAPDARWGRASGTRRPPLFVPWHGLHPRLRLGGPAPVPLRGHHSLCNALPAASLGATPRAKRHFTPSRAANRLPSCWCGSLRRSWARGMPQAAQEIEVLADPADVRNSEAHLAENV
jgi:hypothetical protein